MLKFLHNYKTYICEIFLMLNEVIKRLIQKILVTQEKFEAYLLLLKLKKLQPNFDKYNIKIDEE